MPTIHGDLPAIGDAPATEIEDNTFFANAIDQLLQGRLLEAPDLIEEHGRYDNVAGTCLKELGGVVEADAAPKLKAMWVGLQGCQSSSLVAWP